jgi:hypothetical protein
LVRLQQARHIAASWQHCPRNAKQKQQTANSKQQTEDRSRSLVQARLVHQHQFWRGRFQPKSRQRASPESAPHPAGTSPGRRGGAKKKMQHQDRTQTPAGPASSGWLYAEHQFRQQPSDRPPMRVDSQQPSGRPLLMRVDSQDLSAQGVSTAAAVNRIHQAVAKYLTSDSPSCSDSSNGSNLLSPGWGPVSCHHPGQLAPIVSAALSCVLVLSSAVQESS